MAAAEKKTDTDDDEAPVAPKSKLVPLLLGVNTLLVAGVMAFTLLRKPPLPAKAEDEPEAAEHGEAAKESDHGNKNEGSGPKSGGLGPIVALENFVVQLRAVEAEKYAHITIEIELGDEKDKDVVSNYMPRIRDNIIGYLADRTADEMRGSEGMTAVKAEVLHLLQEVVPGRRVRNVYVTSFIVQ